MGEKNRPLKNAVKNLGILYRSGYLTIGIIFCSVRSAAFRRLIIGNKDDKIILSAGILFQADTADNAN